MSSTPFIRSAPTSFRLVLPTGILSNTTSESVGRLGLSPTATGNATGPAQAPLLAGVGGAGLILVFVACALLLAVLIATFIFRGLRGPRSRLNSGGASWDDFESPAPVTRPPSPQLGEKPRMANVYVTTSSTQQYAPRSAGSWRSVQPLSASRVVDTVTLPTLPKGKRASISSIDSRYSQDDDSLSSIELSPPPRYALDMGSRSPRIPPSLLPTSPKPTNVRVAVPIAMPRPPPSIHNPWNVTSPHDVDLGRATSSYFEHSHQADGEADIPEFCLGVADVSPGKQQEGKKEKK